MDITNVRLMLIATVAALVILQISETSGQDVEIAAPDIIGVPCRVERRYRSERRVQSYTCSWWRRCTRHYYVAVAYYHSVCPCPGQTRYYDCNPGCTYTCAEPFPLCTFTCAPGCYCPPERKFRTDDNRCVATEAECPLACTGGQVWNQCGSACDSTCAEPNPTCTEQCVPRCECAAPTPIWHNGQCIAESSCPACPGDTRFRICQPGCEFTCPMEAGFCSRRKCEEGCYCPDRTPYRTSDDRCVATVALCPDNPCEFGGPLPDANGDQIFCGRGPTREDCPPPSQCLIHPTDIFAVCCALEPTA